MKSLKSFLVAAIALAFSGSAMAQATYTDKNGDEYEFQKHWFMNVEGGMQYTLGEAKFGDLLSPNAQVGIGRQFTPWFGARLAVNAWQSMGGFNGYKLSEGVYGNTTYKYKYVAPGIDLMFNLSNLLCGWNPDRFLNVTAFVGGGANIAFSNDEANTIAGQGYKMEYLWDGSKVNPVGRGGIELAFRLSKAVALTVEGNANVITDKYNSKKAGNADWYFNGLVGLKFNLGSSSKKIEKPAPQPEPVAEPVVVKQEPVVKPEPVKEVKEEPFRRDVFFTINSSVISDEEMVKVEEIANYLKANASATLDIMGAADAGTGTDKINDRLAAERAQVVVSTLINKFGISADRVTQRSDGSRVQPFAENDKNRVSVCVAEKK